MKFDNSTIRRQDRLLDKERALDILREGEYGVLSLCDGESAYGVPMNYVFSENRIYFHCAPSGKKLRIITEKPWASFCIVGSTTIVQEKFTTGYESVMAEGKIVVVDDDEERMEALRLILLKYSPEFYEAGLKYSGLSFGRVTILRLDINTLTAKSKPTSPKGK